MILHEKSVTTAIFRHPNCMVRWTADFWLDAYSERVGGQRYRAVQRNPFDPFKDTYHHPPCSRGSVYEIGGTTNGDVIRFVPPNRLVDTRLRGGPPPYLMSGDPAAALRRALRTGKARDEGRTRRDGRTVEHIRLEWGDAYVDPDTFYPVEIDDLGEPYVPGQPELPRQEIRFEVYEYLPRTAANLALTNIRAQHPHATGP
jgi:hypothetical protein